MRAAIERLAAIDRSSCSTGEHEAAEWIADALRSVGVDAEVEREQVHGTYWWPLGITSAAGLIGGLAARRGRRRTGAMLGAVACAAAIDDLGGGRRVLRSLLPKQTAANVVGWAGDRAGSRTLVLVAHHDAAHTSVFFNPRISDYLASRFQAAPDAPPKAPPVNAPIVLAPALVAVGSLVGLRSLVRLGALLCTGIIASFAEIALRPTVPGANDNLTGVAALLGVASSLQERPVSGLRVLLVSTGAEESLMEGMRAFAARHFASLSPKFTCLLCIDTVGSPNLVLAESEGMLRARPYDRQLNQLIASCARQLGITIREGLAVRLGTDGLIALRHGMPAAMLTSIDHHGVPSNYHWPSDTPENVDYQSLGDAVRLCEAVMRGMADLPGTGYARPRRATSSEASGGASLNT